MCVCVRVCACACVCMCVCVTEGATPVALIFTTPTHASLHCMCVCVHEFVWLCGCVVCARVVRVRNVAHAFDTCSESVFCL